MKKLFIPIILGTNRQGRYSEHAAKLILFELQKRDNIETQIIDVRDFKLPHDNYGTALKSEFPEFQQAVERAHGLLIVSPEYNHGYPGILKSVLDILYDEYADKPVGIAAVTGGPFGGARVIEQLIQVARELGLKPIRKDLNFFKVKELFDENGRLLDENYIKRTNDFLDVLVDNVNQINR